MSRIVSTPAPTGIHYPDSDGKPVAETPQHRDNLLYLVYILQLWFAEARMVYVSGNMFIYYVPGNRRRHVSPDVFVVRGILGNTIPIRRRYLVWEEGKAPDLVIELTSKSTRKEDLGQKFELYQVTLKVSEYFLFDPFEEYLEPSLKGFRLKKGKYVPIEPIGGRLPSKVLGLHLERDGWLLRLYNPKTGLWLPTPPEEHEAHKQAEFARGQAEFARDQAEFELQQEAKARQKADTEVERLRREIETLRGQLPRES